MTDKPETIYVWFDTEYTNLDLEEAALMQVAALITDSRLKRLLPPEQDIRLTLRLPESGRISPWVKENLPDLVKACMGHETIDIVEADARLAAYVRTALATRTAGHREYQLILAGNSVQMDWRLAQRFLPNFLSHLHYRLLDVTAFKLEWNRREHKRSFTKENPADIAKYFPDARLSEAGARHDAYYDIQASIAELAFYRLYMFR